MARCSSREILVQHHVDELQDVWRSSHGEIGSEEIGLRKEAKAIVKKLKSRIVGAGTENPAKILANPMNWRMHSAEQKEALGGMLDEIGWVAEVTINKRTGRMIDGHLRVELAKQRREDSIPVKYVDLSAKEEAIVLASLDPLGDLASKDGRKHRELIAGLEVTGASLGRFLADLGDADANGSKDRPEMAFTEELLEEHNFVVLYFDNEVDWHNLMSMLQLKTVKALHSRKGFNSAGVGRVVKGTEAIALIQGGAKHGR
jgi:hypothetical protein